MVKANHALSNSALAGFGCVYSGFVDQNSSKIHMSVQLWFQRKA